AAAEDVTWHLAELNAARTLRGSRDHARLSDARSLHRHSSNASIRVVAPEAGRALPVALRKRSAGACPRTPGTAAVAPSGGAPARGTRLHPAYDHGVRDAAAAAHRKQLETVPAAGRVVIPHTGSAVPAGCPSIRHRSRRSGRIH